MRRRLAIDIRHLRGGLANQCLQGIEMRNHRLHALRILFPEPHLQLVEIALLGIVLEQVLVPAQRGKQLFDPTHVQA